MAAVNKNVEVLFIVSFEIDLIFIVHSLLNLGNMPMPNVAVRFTKRSVYPPAPLLILCAS